MLPSRWFVRLLNTQPARVSDGQVIFIMDSPEMGFHSQLASETAPSADLGEVPITHEEVREGIPSEQTTSQPAKATSSRPVVAVLLYSSIGPGSPYGGCNTPKYTLVVFNMFRVFCRYNLNFS